MTQEKATWKAVNDKLQELEEKYFHLVWLSRKSSEDYSKEEVAKLMHQVRQDYPKETMHLSSPIDGDWHHGFNSGMLACTRLIHAMKHDSIASAESEFPNLDT